MIEDSSLAGAFVEVFDDLADDHRRHHLGRHRILVIQDASILDPGIELQGAGLGNLFAM